MDYVSSKNERIDPRTDPGTDSVSRSGRNNSIRTRTSTRTKVVLAAFVSSMTAVTGMLLISGQDFGPVNKFAATKPVMIASPDSSQPQSQNPAGGEIDSRWEMIVIHDSGSLSGTVRELDAEARGAGLNGLGYHFVIGNGAGLSDGVVEASYRWNGQLAGAHVAAAPNPDTSEQLRADQVNRTAIGICLIGNGDRSEFTEAQMRALVDLVRALQIRLDIPASRVVLHSDLNPDVASPGRLFPIERLESHLEP